jgi:Ca2+-binding RTX toxin-like protein
MPAPIVWAADRSVATFPLIERRSQLSASPDGRLSVFWNGGQNNGDILNYVYQADALSVIRSVGAYTAGVEQSAASAFLTDGRLVLAYATSPTVGGDIDIRFRVMNGADQNYSTLVADTVANTGATTGNQVSPVVVALANGNFAISWTDLGDNKQKVRVFDVAGNPVSVVKVVSGTSVLSASEPNPSEQPTNMTALSNGGFVVTHNDNGSDSMSIFSATGELVTGGIPLTNSFRSNAAVVETADGRIAVFGTSVNLVRGYTIQFFSLDGVSLGPMTEVGLSPAAQNQDVHVRAVALPDGRFMVVSSSFVESDANADVWAAVIKADGTFDGTPFRVNDTQTGSQSAPSIALMADGRVAISWTDTSANNGDIFLKIYDPRETGVELVGTANSDDYVGSRFNDTVFGGLGNDTVLGGAGDDSVSGGSGADSLRGDGGSDTLDGGIGNDTLNGGAGGDTLNGGAGADRILGEADNDSISGGDGADSMFGGDGNDTLLGQIGSDYLDGQGENDSLYGGDANDTLVGNIGGDYLDGQGENDEIYGNDGRDTLVGNIGNDYLDGGDGDDELLGSAGNDTLVGNLGADRLNGHGENDELYGGAGSDTLLGDAGNDQIWGGTGADSLTGGLGDDQFRFVLADLQAGVRDTITDFAEAGGGNADLLVFFGVVIGTLSPFAGGTLVSITVAGGTAEILVQGFTPTQLADQVFFL